MEYTPTPAPVPPAPKAEYVLVEDMTGLPLPKRDPKILSAVRPYEKWKESKLNKVIEFRVPYQPNKNCKKCFGRGYVGFEADTDNVLLCGKCFPTASPYERRPKF